MNYYKKEFIVRGIKIIDIGYITAVYFTLGIIMATLSDKYFGVFNEKEEKKKPIGQSVIELLLYLWLFGVIIYIVRNVIPLIPFPLNGIYGFDHLKVKEVTSAGMFTIAFLLFQKHYQAKLKYIVSVLST
jgi:hypothetical protein